MTDYKQPEIIRADGVILAKYIGGMVKRISENGFRGHGIRWHDSKRPDLQGEWFSQKTYLMRNAGYPIIGIPTNYQHGQHKDFGNLAIGIVNFVDEDEIGLLIEGEKKTREQYIEMLKEIGRARDIKFSDSQLASKSELAVKAVDTLIVEIPLQLSGGFDQATWLVDNETKHIDQSGMIHLAFTPTPSDDLNPIVRFKSAIDEVLKYESTTSYSLPNATITSHKWDIPVGATITIGAASTVTTKPNQQADFPTGRTGAIERKDDMGASADTEAAQPNAHIVKSTPYQEKPKMALNIKTIKNRYRETVRAELDAMAEEELAAIVEQIAEEAGVEVSPADADEIAADVGTDIEAAVEATADEDAMMMADDELEDEEKRKAVRSIVAKHFYAVAYAKCYAYFGAKVATKAKAKADAQAKARHNHLKAQPATEKLPAYSGNGHNPRISVGENLKFAHLSPSDMALGVLMRTAAYKSQGMKVHIGSVVSEDYIRTMAHKMVSHADSMPYGKSAKGTTALELANKANYHLKNIMPFKANELDASTLTGQGDEWVGEFWSTDVWERERMIRHYDTMVSKGMWVQTIEQGAETAYFPTEDSDPVAYVAPQAFSTDATGRPETTININPFGTGRVSITPKEIKIATAHTTVLEEDSIINIVQTVNRQLNEAAMETRDRLMVNGDTETGTTNINSDGSAPATGLQTPYYIASNGFRKTGITGGRDASNVLNLAQYRLTLAELDPELRQYYERMVFMIDSTTEMASLAIAEIATDDVRRTSATVTSGRLINIHGVDVLVNGFLPSTDTDGKVTASGNVAERGTILLVYAPYWGVAYKRQITLETARDIYSGSNVYVLSMRVGFVPRGANAAAASYNVATAAS